MAETGRKTRATTRKKTTVEKVPSEPVQAVETANKAEETVSAPVYTADDVQRMIQEALARQADSIKPQVVQVTAETEKVVLRWQAEVADDNEAIFGDGGYYGKIVGKRGMLTVPKSEFTSRFLDVNTQWMLKNRWLIVLSGLDETERQMYGVDYKDGEYMDEMAFARLLELSDDELKSIFPALCDAQKQMLAKRFVTAYGEGNGKATGRKREFYEAMNKMSKVGYEDLPKDDARRKGMFAPIIEQLNRAEI